MKKMGFKEEQKANAEYNRLMQEYQTTSRSNVSSPNYTFTMVGNTGTARYVSGSQAMSGGPSQEVT